MSLIVCRVGNRKLVSVTILLTCLVLFSNFCGTRSWVVVTFGVGGQKQRERQRQQQYGPHWDRTTVPCSSQSSSFQPKKETRRYPAAQVDGPKRRRKERTSGRKRFPLRSRSPRSRSFDFNMALKRLVRSGRPNRGGRSVAEQAQDVLMVQVNTSEPNEGAYDTISFNIVLQALANQNSMKSARQADELLSLLLRMSNVSADSYSYGNTIHAYAKSGGKLRAARRATELLEQLESSNIKLTTDHCHNAAINAWSVSGDANAGRKSEEILRRLLKSDSIRPTRVSFNACMKAFAKTGETDEALRLFHEMKERSNTQKNLAPDKITFSSLIDAFSRIGSVEAAHMAEGVLIEMESAFVETGNPEIRPDVYVYTSVMAAYAKSGLATDSRYGLKLLDRMEKYAQERPNAHFLNAWINLLAKTSTHGGTTATSNAETAEDVLRFMKAEYAEGNEGLRPCKITYTAMISVLAQVGTIAAAERAEALLDELEVLWEETSDDAYLPNTKTFVSALNAWSKTCGAPQAWERTKRLFERMEALYERTGSSELKPNGIVFLQMFQILANSKDSRSALRAKELLHRMNDLYLKGNDDVRPDATTYAAVINAFTKSKLENAAELAIVVLEEAESGYKAGMGHLRPSPLLYSSVLQAMAKSASVHGAEQAQALLDKTKAMYRQGTMYAKPTNLFYNAVIDAFARSSGGVAAAVRAEELLHEMESRSLAGDLSLKPTTRSFNGVIFAWMNSNSTEAPIRAEAILNVMEQAYENGNSDLRPDACTYNTCIKAYIRGSKNKEDAAKRALNLYMRMKKHRISPDSITFNLLNRAWAGNEDNKLSSAVLERIEKDMIRFRNV